MKEVRLIDSYLEEILFEQEGTEIVQHLELTGSFSPWSEMKSLNT